MKSSLHAVLMALLVSALPTSMINESIYLYATEDSASVQVYDCFIALSTLYCRRPLHPHSLQRNHHSPPHCHHQGIPLPFYFLANNSITPHYVLHHFKSSLDKAEDYASYLIHSKSPIGTDDYLCNCTHPQSFGRHCEYMLPHGSTPDEIVRAKFTVKEPAERLMYVGEMVCYKTLECDFGRLCLDWRDVCDGREQCMYGLDEENCDLLEFNECEDDEYRCMNGMCIAEECFLDGVVDCMDGSDERVLDDGLLCPQKAVSAECDDRLCGSDEWPCGDGQCVDFYGRLPPIPRFRTPGCLNRRNQFWWCEDELEEMLRTDANGRCVAENLSEQEISKISCHHFLLCQNLSIRYSLHCHKHLNGSFESCQEMSSSVPINEFTRSRIIAPYVGTFLYERKFDSLYVMLILNGSVRCRGFDLNLREVHLSMGIRDFFSEQILNDVDRNYMCISKLRLGNMSDGGYDQFCYNDSRTFNQRPYHFIDSIDSSRSCRSAYRLMNEESLYRLLLNVKAKDLISRACVGMRNHRFRCSNDEITCHLPQVLGDGKSDCDSGSDEFAKDGKISFSQLICDERSDKDCAFLRQYIRASWNDTSSSMADPSESYPTNIPWRSYCDTFMDLYLKTDEDHRLCQQYWECADNEWQCYSGHCINRSWVLDDEWDCPDASDEENMFAYPYNASMRNYQWFANGTHAEKFKSLYSNQTLWGCDPSAAAYRSKTSSRFPLEWTNETNQTDICLDRVDKRSVITDCYRLLTHYGYNVACFTMKRCLGVSNTFRSECSANQFKNGLRCLNCTPKLAPSTTPPYRCWNKTIILPGYLRCNSRLDCRDGEDEYMCENAAFISRFLRQQKQEQVQSQRKTLFLASFPIPQKDNEIKIAQSQQQSPLFAEVLDRDNVIPNASLNQWCNRGVPILSINQTILCFCPPPYHGDQCQYHSDRLTFHFHVNFTHADQSKMTNYDLILKFLILFFFEDQVISTDETHFRPRQEIDRNRPSKKTIYLHYSHLDVYLRHKKQRFFDRMNITHHHPYSIRVELFEMYLNVKPMRLAVWHYPVYFDFLPVFRLSKVLRFFDRKNVSMINPCARRPCSMHEECYPVENDPMRHVCLCREGHFGRECREKSELCDGKYCSAKSLCLAKYRGVINGGEWPYCVCSLNQIGQRCLLYPNACMDNPCQNGGRCYQGFEPHHIHCRCTEKYFGDRCEQLKPSILSNVVSRDIPDHLVVIAEYYDLNMINLRLKKIGDQLYRKLPSEFEYFSTEFLATNKSWLVLLKFIADGSESIYLASLQINTRLNITISLSSQTRCRKIDASLFDPPARSAVLQYHPVCSKLRSISCFYDDHDYLCLCEENRRRAECFSYDSLTSECEHCLASGRCLQGHSPADFLCLCPMCHTGDRCQYNFESFSFTLDQLFYWDLISNDRVIRDLTFYFLLLFPWLLSLIGISSNLCSFLTLRQTECRRSTTGQYLYYMSLVNQVVLISVCIRLTRLTLNGTSFSLSRSLDSVFCKSMNYLLVISTSLTYWLSSLIAIQRLYVSVAIRGKWVKNPTIARRLILMLVMIILIMNAYDLYLIRAETTSEDQSKEICTRNFPQSRFKWIYLHSTVTVIDTLGPFLINLICTFSIIHIVVKKKMHMNQHRTTAQAKKNEVALPTIAVTCQDERTTRERWQLFRKSLIENKELIFGPAITLIPQFFSLPFFIASLILQCQNLQGNSLRYLLIVSFFAKFIPPMINFHLYISPSTFYRNEWQRTKVYRWIRQRVRH